MQRVHVQQSQRGFTLLEVMVAAALLAVGILGLLPLFYRATAGTAGATRMTEATNLAEAKLWELTRLPFDASALAAGSFNEATNLDFTGSGGAGVAFGAKDGSFARSWTIEEKTVDPGSAVVDFKQITVQVTWYDGVLKRTRHVMLVGGRARVD